MKFISMLPLLWAGVVHAQLPGKFEGQGPIKAVPTDSRPVQKQWKGVFSFPQGGVYFSNDFTGARLNGVARLNDSAYVLLITSENTPVNASPWYAFKVWSRESKKISVKLTYQQGARHRYAPKLRRSGKDWQLLNSAANNNTRDTSADGFQFLVDVSKDTAWIASQELLTSVETGKWIKSLGKKLSAPVIPIGKTHLGKDISLVRIGDPASKNRILIIGRQHPPEVTGQIAQQAFIERIGADDSLAVKFRKRFLLYVVPLMNPDGVDEGFWRHNAGGVDLNRDWDSFNQPETKAVRDFLSRELKDGNNKLWFGLDFHSTHDDIFYIVDPKLKGVLPGLVQDWLHGFELAIPGYVPNVKPLYSEGPTSTSFSYLFKTYGTEALVYEIGDNTSREFIVKKSQVAAESLMRLLVERVDGE